MPANIKGIGLYSSWECSSLESISIPNAIERVYRNAFDKCSNLEEIDFLRILNRLIKVIFKNVLLLFKTNILRFSKNVKTICKYNN